MFFLASSIFLRQSCIICNSLQGIRIMLSAARYYNYIRLPADRWRKIMIFPEFFIFFNEPLIRTDYQ